MRISITLKLRPFSHLAGARCLIPYTTWEVQAFPALLLFHNLETKEQKRVVLDVKGPPEEFTLFLDLERGRVELIRKGEEKLFITPENFPFLHKRELPSTPTRLSFGVHKKQDWDLISRRCDLTEIFPFWVRLSQLIPELPLPSPSVGTMHLLENIEDGLFCRAGFQGILSPRLEDEHHLGVVEEGPFPGCPLGLLHASARQILNLFFQEVEDKWHILPRLPKEFHAGRMVSYVTRSGHLVDLEWSKKQIKKIVIHPAFEEKISLCLKKGLKSYRVRENLRQKGERMEAGAEISLQPHKPLYLDRFMN